MSKISKENIYLSRLILALVLVFTMTFSNFNVVEASNVKTMTVDFEESTTRDRSKTVIIPNLKSIVSVETNTGKANHSINANNVTINVSGGAARKVQIGGNYTPASSKTETTTRTGTARRRMDTGTDTGFAPSSISFNSGGYSGILSQTSFDWTGPLGWSSDGEYWTRSWKAYYSGIVTKPAVDTRTYDNYYSYTATIKYIDNADPKLELSLPVENSYFGKEVGYNIISIQGNVKDIDIDDEISIKYNIFDKKNNKNLTEHTEKFIKNIPKSNGDIHEFNYILNVDDTIPDGEYILKIITEDNNGGKVEKDINIAVDKTPPITSEPIITVNSSTQITVEASSEDLGSGLHSECILWNKNDVDFDNWIDINPLIEDNLTPNTQYSYKYKARDAVNNVSEYSNEVSKYTLALYPEKIQLQDTSSTEINFKIFHNQENGNATENQIILREKNVDKIVGTSEWSKEETITITGLEKDKIYEVWLNTRNEDKVENGEVKLPSDDVELVDSNDNLINEVLTNRTPEINLLSKIDGRFFSLNESFDKILVKATVKDEDIGDILKIKYTFLQDGINIEDFEELQLGEEIIANGELQEIEEEIEIVSLLPEGELELNLWVEDDKGGKSTPIIYNIIIDKTPPITSKPIVTVNSSIQITVEASSEDLSSGLHSECILWNKNDMDFDNWSDINPLIEDNLTPNTQYIYKYKARDAVDNVSEYSKEVSKYTLALNPIRVKLEDYTSTTAAFIIDNNEENENIPETQIIIKRKGIDEVVVSSDWSKDETKIIQGLEENQLYEVWLNTRNEDKVENGEVKLSSISEPLLVNHNGNPIDDFTTSDEKASPIITIKPYNTTLTNQNITVYAETNKGTLNQESYTFTGNGSFTFIATTLLGNKTEKVVTITNIDKVPPVITIEPYEMEPTNQDITVYAKVDKGKLNQESYTFIENGSFTFIATDEAGNISKETVTITNIDKNLPTEGEIKIIAVDEEGRIIKTIQKKNLGLGVQVITAPEISGCKLISTPVVTIWLKPADNVKKVTFTYKLDKAWDGWKDAEEAVKEAEKAVEKVENNPTEKGKEEVQKKIEEARDIVDRLPESEEKDRLNKKLDELEDRLDKIIIIENPFDSKNKKKIINEETNKEKIIELELENIPLDKFIARWENHEAISKQPIRIEEKSKPKFNIYEEQFDILNKKGLTPRIYKWNEEKEKWVALATKVEGNKIETYEDIEGYVAVFAVKQPTFSDIKGNEWFTEITDRANGLALIEGFKDNKDNVILKPNSNISKAEFYTITSRLFGALKEGENSLYNVLDLKQMEDAERVLAPTKYEVPNWAKPYTASLYEKGIIKETEGHTDLSKEITRIEGMNILSKLLKQVEDVESIDISKFKDSKEIKEYERIVGENVELADVVKGYQDKTLRPNNNMTRAEALTIIINALEKLGW
ncbi:S-layer homology domain-containing protein [Tissierella praeacuta]|uniref:S-layer homology domain-containing protein n=1 Tax=Tissierella praeacuta TaxID=43131 RepID=UPI0028AA3A9B|nr:S-layer homology domain-containing protein [Tissierella praeacuta]